MNSNERYLNVQYGTLPAEVNVTGISRLGGIQDAIKAKYGSSMANFDAAQIQLFDQGGNHINNSSLFSELDPKYFEEGGLFLVIRITSQVSGPPTQSNLGWHVEQASPELSAFWTAFTEYSGSTEANSVVQLPQGVSILGNTLIRSSIFVRPCYPKLLDIALSIVESVETWHLIILGTPGIGKTYFGYFLLLHLARSRATVVYDNVLDKRRYLFTPNGVYKGTHESFCQLLDNSETFYIADAVSPLVVAAKTILISSLKNEIWSTFAKHSCDIRYMPVWSKDEIESCRAILYPLTPKDDVEIAYSKWGGIVRYVLAYQSIQGQQALMNEALDASNIDSVLESFGSHATKSDASSRLVHRSVTDDFFGGPYQFASAYVVQEVYNRVSDGDQSRLIRFLTATRGVREAGQLRGVLFEKHAHTAIARGGVFKIRNLKTNAESTLDLSKQLTRFSYTTNNNEFQNAEDCYFVPVSRNFESVDSFIKPSYLFQMTCSLSHPCKQAGLDKLLRALGNPPNPELYFVVPPDLFAEFKHQNYIGTNNKVLSEENTTPSVKELSQFVLTFDLHRE